MSRTALLSAGVILGAALIAPTTSVAAPAGDAAASSRVATSSLRISPSVYVAGQAVVFRGALGVAGRRQVHLQTHLGRPGDTWLDLDGSAAHTRRDGSFAIRRPAPGMQGIRYRVISDRWATPALNLAPRVQEVLLDVDGGKEALAPGQVRAGRPFTIRADTTPTLRRAFQASPAIPGRTMTLEQRVAGPAWRPVATTTSDADGQGSFALTAGPAGEQVYRVRLEDWTAGRNDIGWFASFPSYVHVVDAPIPAERPARTASPPAPRPRPATRGASPTAASRYAWGAMVFGYEWELGQSLTSPASRGTRTSGQWRDASDGTGRAFVRNGALAMSSEVYNRVDGTRGSTWATLDGRGRRYGRWESRMWVQSLQDVAPDFTMVVELVPANPSQAHCGEQNITVAEVTAHGSSVTVGARSVSKPARWTRVVSGVPVNRIFYNYGVEVAKDHITWFLNGKPVASTREPSLLSGVALTPRISLQGAGDVERNSTQALVDWSRAFDLRPGHRTVTKQALRRGPAEPAC